VGGVSPEQRRVAVRCDGDEVVGAGHVARCLPLARALAEIGWAPEFVGRYGGLAAWLLDAAGMPSRKPDESAPAGVAASRWDAAIVDSYGFSQPELCALARALPIATLGEAPRCPDAGVWIDYHLDRAGDVATPRLLPGPAFAPIDPRFAGVGRARDDVRDALVTVGGSTAAQALVEHAAAGLRRAFPGVRLVVASGAALEGPDVERLAYPATLVETVSRIDLAVSAAGLTAYELACAGLPTVLVPVADNQRRVVSACVAAGVALGSDADAEALLTQLDRLRDAALRAQLSAAGRAVLDGRGAQRAAAGLVERWR
jgi:UDP-2,4-diacetamido-2,4,6-trideoxy-beta-L-altropyranose hydrolase